MDNIDDMIKYKLKCKMSEGLKSESDYSKKEFEITTQKDENSDSGYTSIVSGYNDEDEFISNEWDGEVVFKNILFGNWIVIKKKRI